MVGFEAGDNTHGKKNHWKLNSNTLCFFHNTKSVIYMEKYYQHGSFSTKEEQQESCKLNSL